ncbi:MAG: 3-hydroxyacyl-ACP dehydratase FabZ [Bdellovibrionales bacterium]|nr:3-hydroxyacyl-ACP dehydratase FabZ [Bdellovibrionales bacterium]
MYPAITEMIPQRPPFLFVDKVVDRNEKSIKTTFNVTGEEDFFKGHFPGNPIMPGVLLQEALFQTGAALMSGLAGGGLGVVTRVQNAKFKNMVRPGDLLEMEVELTESISNAHYMKGTTKVAGKTVLVIEFAVASV